MREHSTHFALVAIFIYTPCVVVVSGGLGLPNHLPVITHDPTRRIMHPLSHKVSISAPVYNLSTAPIKIFAPDSPVLYIEREGIDRGDRYISPAL
jgi:hypothetical protein